MFYLVHFSKHLIIRMQIEYPLSKMPGTRHVLDFWVFCILECMHRFYQLCIPNPDDSQSESFRLQNIWISDFHIQDAQFAITLAIYHHDKRKKYITWIKFSWRIEIYFTKYNILHFNHFMGKLPKIYDLYQLSKTIVPTLFSDEYTSRSGFDMLNSNYTIK